MSPPRTTSTLVGVAAVLAALVALGLLVVSGGDSRDLAELLEHADAVRETATAGGALACEQCHGVPPQTGSHRVHADPDRASFGFDCSACHYVERFPDQHDNGKAEVRFRPGIGAFAGALPGRYSRGTCAELYCHSDARGSDVPVRWAAGTTVECGDCHDTRTSSEIDMSGEHAFHLNTAVECPSCHAGVVDLSDRVVDHLRHVDGSIDVAVLAGIYDPATRGCSPGCHEPRQWRRSGADGR